MAIWILDTNQVSALLEGNNTIKSKLAEISPNDIAITVVTVQEIFNGWVCKINNTSESKDLVRLYTKLSITLDFFKAVSILNFDETASKIYEKLIHENRELNKKKLQKDLRIAAITLSVNGIMVTANKKDFSLIPGLVIEDWTDPSILYQ
ncbi:type II toxin-antitoxin system VapC family toxin [Planktothrix sp. FACHB-1365]|uniref:type II toxin-antitoxin system VapC family toxin n=1 Tax=Planktothrix sp. FACHB-1365 TaxID=2692855 RepID=UPI0016851BBD|nr:type II toxin-antitoxin system VapC family toxin [Planktothrix sp. FACHB-1365]MBD2483466.1 type II toxin-antitoxin system VapC family toxin [Planktothrix sp. FACHB-1365]